MLPLPANAMLNMVWISPWHFIMGSLVSEPGRKADESPQTDVTLTKGYWLGKTELTIGQWKAVTGESLKGPLTGKGRVNCAGSRGSGAMIHARPTVPVIRNRKKAPIMVFVLHFVLLGKE